MPIIVAQASMSVNIDRCRFLSDTRPMPLAPLPIVTADPAPCCSPLTGEPMNEQDATVLSTALKALADPARLRLLSVIAASAGHESCVCDLVDAVHLSQPTVSHHLKVLTDAGYVTREKRGVWAYYTLVPGALDAIAGHLGTHLAPAAA
jgi:ArsR family transcriptional regulator